MTRLIRGEVEPTLAPFWAMLRPARRASRWMAWAAVVLAPLLVPVAWATLERSAQWERAGRMAQLGAAGAASWISEVTLRFEQVTQVVRPAELAREPGPLAGLLPGLEAQLRPAAMLTVFDTTGRPLASSYPFTALPSDIVRVSWFRRSVASPGVTLLTSARLTSPLGGREDFVLTRRLDDEHGQPVAVIVAFVSGAAMRHGVTGLTAPRAATEIRLLDAAGQPSLASYRMDTTAPRDPPTGVLGHLLRQSAGWLDTGRVASGAARTEPGQLWVEVHVDPWDPSVGQPVLLGNRGVMALGIASLLWVVIFGRALRRKGHGSVPRAAPRRFAPLTAPPRLRRQSATPLPLSGPPPASASAALFLPVGPELAWPPEDLNPCPVSAWPTPRAAAPAKPEELEAAASERDRVLAAIGHDVRTPLNSLLGIVALLLDGELEESQRRWVERMRASCELLLAMLNGMLEASSAERDGAELQADDVDVANLVEEVCDVLRPQAHDKGLELIMEADEAACGIWRTDPTRVRQVLVNLVGNAIKYTDDGQIDIRASGISLHDGRHMLRLQVTDTGPGIELAKRALIFERFQRGAVTSTMGREGVGLGLSLCRDVALLMGGTLSLESGLGVGSSFTFEFPAERSLAGDQRRSALFTGRSALVIGLSEGVRRRATLNLQGLGFGVEGAVDGFLGLGLAERIAATHGALDLVVLDGALTGLAAEAVLQRLRGNRQLEAAQVIWVGGSDQAGMAAGADAVISHPAEPRDIERAARQLLAPTSVLQAIDPEAPALAEGRVLVVEDNKINQALLADVLRRNGFSVFTANNGEEAVQAASRGGFDLVLMDVQMPGINGIEATRRIRSAERASGWRTPIVALTAHTGAVIRRQCVEAGAAAVLHKPVNMARLAVQLREIIASNRDAAVERGRAEAEPADPLAAGAEGMVQTLYLEALIAEVGAVRAREAMRAFVTEASTRVTRLEELTASCEWEPITRTCHELAGLAGTLGATLFADALFEMEACARGRHAREIDDTMQAVLRAWVTSRPRLTAELDRLLGAGGGVATLGRH